MSSRVLSDPPPRPRIANAARAIVLAAALAVLGAATTATTTATTAATAAAAPAPADRAVAEPVPAVVLSALQRDLGLSADQVRKRLAQQAKAVAADRVLRARTGAAFAGSWFDPESGTLVVAVTDAGLLPELAAAGARGRLVEHTAAHLEGIRSQLDALAGRPKNATRSTPAGWSQPALAGMVSWYVDVRTNSVAVTVLDGPAGDVAAEALAKYRGAVRIERTPGTPSTTAEFMDGGDEINGGCAAGFNLRNPSTGQGYLLTAGHCVASGGSVTGRGGVIFGPVIERWFPSVDDALIRNDNPGYWLQGPWVDTNPSSGPVVTITGFTDAPVGTAICKSGITTKLTCGTITAKDETVTFDGVYTVFGLTRHSACVERGDSGGSNYTVGANTAEGVTSGARLYGGRCGQAVGQPTISWYFPIADSLAYYGPRYNVVLW